MEEIRKIIVEFAETSKKSKFYFNDMEKAVKEKMRCQDEISRKRYLLVNEEKLIFFSTGSNSPCTASKEGGKQRIINPLGTLSKRGEGRCPGRIATFFI
jgi:hypothetical protein